MAASDKELELHLMEAGNRLVEPPSSADELILLLDQVESCLSRVEQSPSQSMLNALSPSLKALVAEQLFRHPDDDVKVAVAACISEITRITAPDAPYDDDQMKEVFQLIVSSFENLSDKSSRSFLKRTSILETVAKVRSCVVMLDLECDALIIEMFQHFLKAIRDYHTEVVFTSMVTIMTLVLEESEDISAELLSPILASVKRDNEEVLPVARRLAERVVENCALKLKPYLTQAVENLGISFDDYSSVVASICQVTPVAVEQNDVATDKRVNDESKPAEAPLDKAAQQEDKEIPKEAVSTEQVDLANEISPKPVVCNGIEQTAEDDSLADSNSLKKQEDEHLADKSENADTLTVGEPDRLEAEKVVNSDSKSEQNTQEKGRKSDLKSTEPSDSSHVNEKEAETLMDHKNDSKDDAHSPCEDLSVNEAVSLENKRETDVQPSSPKATEDESTGVDRLETEKVVNSDSKSEQNTQEKGRKSDLKSTEPFDSSHVNEKEAETLMDHKNDSKDDAHSPCEDLSVDEAVSSENKRETDVQPSSPKATEDESTGVDRLEAEKVVNLDSKSEQNTQEKGRKSDLKSTEPFDSSHVNEKEAETLMDHKNDSKDDAHSPCEDLSVDEAVSSENKRETDVQPSSPKATEDESTGVDRLEAEKVVNSDSKSEQNTQEKGRKSDLKSTEPFDSSHVNEKEAETLMDHKNDSKDDAHSPCEDLSVDEAVSSENKRETDVQPSSPKATEDESTGVDRLEAEKVVNSDSKSEQNTQEKGRKSDLKSTEPFDSSHVNEKEAETLMDHKNDSKDDAHSPCEDLSVDVAVSSENKRETDVQPSSPKATEDESTGVDRLEAEKVVNLDSKSEQNTQEKGRKSDLKSTEPFDSSHVNEKEAETLMDHKNDSKDDAHSPCEDLSVDEAVSSENKRETDVQPSSPKATEDESTGVDRLEAEKVVNLDSKSEQNTQEKGRKSDLKSTEPFDSSHVNEKEAETLMDHKVDSKDDAHSPCEDLSVDEAVSSENKRETDVQPSSPKATEDESTDVASPTPSWTIPDENHSERAAWPKTKESLSKDTTPSVDVSKKASEGTSDSEAKTNRRLGRKVATVVSNEDNVPADVDETKKESGTASDSEAKPLKELSEKVDSSSNNIDGSSSRQLEDKKRRARGKVVPEKDEEMVASPKSVKPNKHDSYMETPKTNPKRKHTPSKEKASDSIEHGENLVGLKVKVWWPKDRVFYEGVIHSFDCVKKKHKVHYIDGDKEILNLKREKWEVIENESGSDEEEAADHPSPDSSSEMPQKKKAKTADQPSKKTKVDASPKRGGGASSGKSKGAVTKSGRKTKEDGKVDGKSKDGSKSVSKSDNENVTKSKDDTPKSGSKSIDIASKVGNKSKNEDSGDTPKSTKSRDDGSVTPKASTKSMQDTSKTAKSKQETPKISSNSKGKPLKSGGKSNASKSKSGSSNVKESENVKENSTDSTKVVESAKRKSPSSFKAQGSDSKSGKKQRR